MATRKKKTAPAPEDAEPKGVQLLDALKFVKLAQADGGAPSHSHCVLFGQWAYGFDGILSAGHPILEDLALAPLTKRLVEALERCEGALAMVALPSGLSVKAGRFRAIVPCHTLADMPNIQPDPSVTAIDDRLRAAFAAVGPLASEGALKVFQACIRLSGASAVGSNGHMLVEYWHGLSLPTVLIPKQAVKAIEAVKKPLASFGFSSGTATFYFDDGSWIKTQLYEDKYPNFERVLSKPSDQHPVTEGLFDALRKVRPFVGEDKAVRLSKDCVHTARNKELEGSSYDVPGLPNGNSFNIDYLLLLEPIAKTVDLGSEHGANLMFSGDNVRGAIAPMNTLN